MTFRRMMPVSLVPHALVLALVLAPRAEAQEFSFHEPGARAASLGGAFTARADDAAALFYNPAGLAFLKSLRVKTNIMFADRTTTAAMPEGGRTYHSSPNEILGAHAVAWQPVRRLTLAAGLFSPLTYESLWSPGSAVGNATALRNSLRTNDFRIALAFEVFKGFAVGGGLDFISSTVTWRHHLPFELETYPLPATAFAESRHQLSGTGRSFTAGVLWKVIPAVQVGASYRDDAAIEYAGRNSYFVNWLALNGTVPSPYGGTYHISDLLSMFYAPQDVTGRLTLPRKLSFGLAVTPVSKLSLYLDVERTRWSDLGDWEFRSTQEGGDLNPGWTQEFRDFYGIDPDYGVQGVALHASDTTNVKAGLEYRPASYLAVRAGYARLKGSIGAADLTMIYPDIDRGVFTLGFGYEGPLFSFYGSDERVSDLSFDLFIRYATAGPEISALPGLEMTYDSRRLVFGAGVGFIF